MKPKTIRLTAAVAAKVLATVDAGLTSGLGDAEPGKMCVEAAVCYALGLPHGDDPPCVGAAVRAFKIALNDGPWSSDKARAGGLREIAIAQLGSDKIDQAKFAKLLAIATVQRVVPLALRAAAKLAVSPDAERLEAAAVSCESAKTLAAASYAASTASYAASAASAASKTAGYAASKTASYAASTASYAASKSASYAAGKTASYAASKAASAAAGYAASAAAGYASSAAAGYAASAASAASMAEAPDDAVLSLAASIGVDVLKKCKSPGIKWLRLTKKGA